MEFLPDISDTIILFDRGYPSEEMFKFLHTRGIHFLMRVLKTFKKAVFNKPDVLFIYPDSQDGAVLTLRNIHFRLEDNSTGYLVTNLMPDQIQVDDFRLLAYYIF